MKIPTDEQLATYSHMLEVVQVARLAGHPDQKAEDDLRKFMVETGIANEAPIADFPELETEHGKI